MSAHSHRSQLHHSRLRLLAASTAGGPAPQYRVQTLPAGQANWQMFTSFGDLPAAESCVCDLQARGIEARVVAIRIFPTAA